MHVDRSFSAFYLLHFIFVDQFFFFAFLRDGSIKDLVVRGTFAFTVSSSVAPSLSLFFFTWTDFGIWYIYPTFVNGDLGCA